MGKRAEGGAGPDKPESRRGAGKGLLEDDSLTDSAYDALREMILSRRLRPGDALPEAKLAQDLSMSRSTVRDGLKRLRDDGLVSFIPGRGSFVQSFSTQDVMDVYDLRELIEGLAARLLARRITREQADALCGLAAKADEAMATPRDAMEFHSAVIDMCGSRKVRETARSLRVQLAMYEQGIHRPANGRYVGISSDTDTPHEDLARRIALGDAAGAEQEARNHVRLAKKAAVVFLMGVDEAVVVAGRDM